MANSVEHVFSIHELVCQICDHCPQSGAAALARTAKGFLEPSLDNVWHSPKSLEVIVKLLPLDVRRGTQCIDLETLVPYNCSTSSTGMTVSDGHLPLQFSRAHRMMFLGARSPARGQGSGAHEILFQADQSS